MRILKLIVRNFCRIEAFEATETGGVITLTGRNGSGKSSVLNAIKTALGGVNKKTIPNPIHEGADGAEIVAVLGDSDPRYIVTRTFGEDGKAALKVATAEGHKLSSPQALLNGFLGAVSIDPVEFLNMRPADQFDALRSALPADVRAKLDKLESEHVDLYNRRTEIGREVKRLAGALASMPKHDDAPDQPVDVAGLMGELERADAENAAHNDTRRQAVQWRANVDEAERHHEEAVAEVARLQQLLSDAEDEEVSANNWVIECEEKAVALEAAVEALEDVDTAPIREQIATADQVNAKVRANAERAKVAEDLMKQEAEQMELTSGIDLNKAEQRDTMAAADFPVEGVTLEGGQVLLDGQPFVQASDAQRLRTSCAVAMAGSPQLRVMLVSGGERLDPESMAALVAMAEEHDYQLWIEDVRAPDDAPGRIVITDGIVAE